MSERDKIKRRPRSWDEARRMARESADAMTDKEDISLHAAALADADNPPLTDTDWTKMKPIDPERVRRWRGQKARQKS